MQKYQILCGASGSCKYFYKYVANVDKNHFFTVSEVLNRNLIC